MIFSFIHERAGECVTCSHNLRLTETDNLLEVTGFYSEDLFKLLTSVNDDCRTPGERENYKPSEYLHAMRFPRVMLDLFVTFHC